MRETGGREWGEREVLLTACCGILLWTSLPLDGTVHVACSPSLPVVIVFVIIILPVQKDNFNEVAQNSLAESHLGPWKNFCGGKTNSNYFVNLHTIYQEQAFEKNSHFCNITFSHLEIHRKKGLDFGYYLLYHTSVVAFTIAQIWIWIFLNNSCRQCEMQALWPTFYTSCKKNHLRLFSSPSACKHQQQLFGHSASIHIKFF